MRTSFCCRCSCLRFCRVDEPAYLSDRLNDHVVISGVALVAYSGFVRKW